MENIREELKKIISGKKKISRTEIKNAISADYMKSGVEIINNDSTSQFVGGKKLLETLIARAEEGVFGGDAVERFDEAKASFSKIKKNDSVAQSMAYVKFDKVDGIESTYARFEKAVLVLKELGSDKTFSIISKNDGKTVKYDRTSAIVVQNLEAIRNLAKQQYGGKVFEANKEALTILSTIFTLRAIAKKEEEDKVDDVAEQLLPYLANSIVLANKKYMGDSALIMEALKLATKRVDVLNSALSGDDKITCDISKILLDERLYVEMNKVANEFRDYNINFYSEGSNKPLSYIDEKGVRRVCQTTEKHDIYSICETVNKYVIKDSMIDTDEEVFMSSFMNLIVVENLENISDEQRKQFSMAFALNLVQSMNKLGDEKCQTLAREVIENLVALESCDENNQIPKSIRKSLSDSLSAIKTGIDGYNPAEEVKTVEKPKKTKTIADVRKALIKRLDAENKSYYGKVATGKKKVKDRDNAISLATSIKGLIDYNGKVVCQKPEEVLASIESSQNVSEVVFGNFVTEYLGEYAEAMVGLSEEEYKEKYEVAKKDVKSFHKEKVQNPNKVR